MGCSKNYFSPELCIGVGWSRERDRVIQTDTQIRIHTHTYTHTHILAEREREFLDKHTHTNRKSWAEIVVELKTIAWLLERITPTISIYSVSIMLCICLL